MILYDTKMMRYLVLISILLISCQESIPKKLLVTNYGNTQGTTYSIKYLSNEGINYKKDIDSLLEVVNNSLSTYETESIISKVNRNEDLKIDSLFKRVCLMALQIASETDGAFDPTIGPLVNFWGFGSEETANNNKDILDDLKNLVDYKGILIINDSIVKANPKMEINFNAIAQGFTVDLISEYLNKKNITNYMIEIGGELKCSGQNAEGNLWRIGIEKPSEKNLTNQYEAIIEVPNKAVASSGNYRKLKIDKETGIKYAHTLNPKTGMPEITNLLSVTIITESCMVADAIATACMVMGKDKSIDYIKSKPKIDAFLIYSGTQGEWLKYQTEGFKKMNIHKNN